LKVLGEEKGGEMKGNPVEGAFAGGFLLLFELVPSLENLGGGGDALFSENMGVPTDQFFVYYGNEAGSPDGAVKSSGDDRTGGNSEGDDEIISVDLGRLDPRIEQIIFTVTIHEFAERMQNFGQVRNSFIRICDATNGQELCKYDLDEDFSVETAIDFGRLYKRGTAWRFEAIGIGAAGGLQTFVNKYAKRFT
jgi:tellurium resistance protein TerD